MARRPNQTRAFRALIEKLTPDLQRAFHAAIADLRDRVDMAALVDRLRANDIAGAIEALNLSPGAFYQYAAVKTSAYAQGGALAPGRNVCSAQIIPPQDAGAHYL